MSFDETSDNVLFGWKCQEIVIKFLIENYNYEFVCGDRNGKIVNEKRFKEIIKSFKEIKTDEFKGTQLFFIDSDGWEVCILMPDELFKRISAHEFVEIKGRRTENFVWEKKVKIDKYLEFQELFGELVSIIFCIESKNGYDLYYSEISDAINFAVLSNRPKTMTDYKTGERFDKYFPIYVWENLSKFKKLNNKIIPLNYLDR